MKIEFKYLKFSNIMSFGSEPVFIDFQTGIYLIIGKNGCGKSSILDCLSFCLFGKPYRKIKIEELINRKNKKNLKTEVEFIVDGKDTFKIIRNQSPDLFQIFKNGQEIDILSSKRLNQDEIDKIIGINYNIFKQTISLAISYNQPFLSLDAKEKRKTIEYIFGLSIFGKMNEILKKKVSDKNKLFDSVSNLIKNIHDNLVSLKDQITEMISLNKNANKVKQEKIQRLERDIEGVIQAKNQKESKLKKIVRRIERLEKVINFFNLSDYKQNEKKYESDLVICQTMKKEFQKKIKTLKEHSICPVTEKQCDQLSEENKKRMIQDYEMKIGEQRLTEEARSEQLTMVKEKIEKIDRLKSKKDILKNEKKIIDNGVEYCKEEDKRIKDEIKTVQNENNQIDIKKFKDGFHLKAAEYKKKRLEKEELKTDLEHMETVSGVLSDKGIKAYIVDKIVPLINKKVNEYMDIFEIPLKIIFDKQMEEKIINLSGIKNNINYYSCSEGEKKRIDFAILLSLIDVMKTISNWHSNLLMIDELLDSSIDEAGLEKMLQTLKKISDNKKMGIYVISHRINNNIKKYFDMRLEIEKNINGFSKVSIEKETNE